MYVIMLYNMFEIWFWKRMLKIKRTYKIQRRADNCLTHPAWMRRINQPTLYVPCQALKERDKIGSVLEYLYEPDLFSQL